MGGQAAAFHEGIDREAVQDAKASEVHRDANDLSAAPVDSADVIAEKLVEDVPAHLEIFVDLDVDQSAVEDEVSVAPPTSSEAAPKVGFSTHVRFARKSSGRTSASMLPMSSTIASLIGCKSSRPIR
jgi:hypothetical protein